MDYLEQRERHLGGYDIVIVPVTVPGVTGCCETLVSILYYATPQNDLFLGDEPLNDVAETIATAQGVCGSNCEYLLRITDFMRSELPHIEEPHLYELDRLVRMKLGLEHSNILPWNSLVTLEMFHKKLLRLRSRDNEQTSDNMTSSLGLELIRVV